MKKIFFGLVIVLTGIIYLAGCTKKIDEAYANPNADVRVPVEQLLPPIISTFGANAAGHGVLNDIRFIGKYVQNFLFCNSGGQFDQMGGATGGTDNAASLWRVHYYDIGQNCMKMIEWATEEKKWDYVGVGQAIFAWSWLTLTDYHGEVILKEAFNTNLLTFHYDTQEEVYEYVRELCFKALENLNKTGDGVSQANLALGDAFFYNGDVNKWKKFVYGVLARSYHHLTNKSIYKPDSVIYFCDLSITTNADNALVKFGFNGGVSATANFWGPLRGNLASTVITTETAIRQSKYIADLMSGLNTAVPLTVGTNDPRAWYLLRTNANGTFKGLTPNKGATVITANDRPESFWGISNVSSISNAIPANDNNCRFIFTNTAPFPVMTASEILFMKAEAALRKGDKATALTAYTNAISLNFDMLTSTYQANVPVANQITPASKAAYMAQVVPGGASAMTLTKIMLQKYIALWGWGVTETWVDMRRYHYTNVDPETGQQVYADFIPPAGTDLFVNNNGKLVYRVRPRYNSEYVWNFNELVRIGADKLDYHTKECWFSQP